MARDGEEGSGREWIVRGGSYLRRASRSFRVPLALVPLVSLVVNDRKGQSVIRQLALRADRVQALARHFKSVGATLSAQWVSITRGALGGPNSGLIDA
jgi:hypothetical protein